MQILCDLEQYDKLIIDFENSSFLLLGKEQVYGVKESRPR